MLNTEMLNFQIMKLEPAEHWPARSWCSLRPSASSEDGRPLIEIAGSIRRRRAEVNDIDIVCLPKGQGGNCASASLRKQPRILTDGQWNMIVELEGPSRTGEPSRSDGGVQLDIFMASHGEPSLFGEAATNYGSLLLCRTGKQGQQHQTYRTRQGRGLVWDPYWGVKNAKGDVIACETEQAIFATLGLAFVERWIGNNE